MTGLVQIEFDDDTFALLEACAAHRGVSIEEVARAYVEDWIDVDYPALRGRIVREATYRDEPLRFADAARHEKSLRWRRDLLGGDA